MRKHLTAEKKAIIVSCVFCGYKAYARFHAKVIWKELESSWYQCDFCSGLMIIPLPKDALLEKVYGENYRNRRLQPHAGVDNRIRYSSAYRSTVFKEYLMSLRDLGLDNGSFKAILDYGCADGIFLEFCKNHFSRSELYGADVAKDMLEDARKKGFSVTHVNALSRWGKTFDFITLWDVVEHLPHPYTTLKELTKLLTKNGRILIQTPCFGIIGEVLGSNWEHLLPVQHVSIASKKSIEQLAKRLGFTIEKHITFGANAPVQKVHQPYKTLYDTLVKRLNIGSVQLVSLRRLA